MDNNINKALWLGVGILFFIAVVSMGLGILNKSSEIAQLQSKELNKIQENLANSKFSTYDNQTVSGSQVINAIKNLRDEKDRISIQVITKKSTKMYLSDAIFYDDEVELLSSKSNKEIEQSIKYARDETKENFINPVAEFDSQIRKDKNGVISGIIFTQF